MRFYLGTGKYTPNAAVQGEMGWKPILHEQWKVICNHWSRCLNYDSIRVNKKIFNWTLNKGSSRCKNWSFIVTEKLKSVGLDRYLNLPFSCKQFLKDVSDVLMQNHVQNWKTDLERVTAVNGTGGNKLRTYKLFKSTYTVEPYCKLNMSFGHRSAYAKFRCGVAPLRIETGRYENLPLFERKCPFCVDKVETEMHVLLECPMYVLDRQLLFEKANSVIASFHTLCDTEKLRFIFTHPDMIWILAKTCFNILRFRNNQLYSKNNS